MSDKKHIRVYHRGSTCTICSVFALKNRYKFLEHDYYSMKAINVAYVDRPFPNIDFNEEEIEYGLKLINFTDWDSMVNTNPCLGNAMKDGDVITYYFSRFDPPISKEEYVKLFESNGFVWQDSCSSK